MSLPTLSVEMGTSNYRRRQSQERVRLWVWNRQDRFVLIWVWWENSRVSAIHICRGQRPAASGQHSGSDLLRLSYSTSITWRYFSVTMPSKSGKKCTAKHRWLVSGVLDRGMQSFSSYRYTQYLEAQKIIETIEEELTEPIHLQNLMLIQWWWHQYSTGQVMRAK